MHHQASARPASPLTSGAESGPDSKSGAAAATGSAVGRPSSPSTPGGPRAAMRRRAAADHKETLRNARPSSTRSAGAGGSSGTMLKLYTDESPGLRVDPVVVLVLSLGFIFSVVGLHGKNALLSGPDAHLEIVVEMVADCILSSHRQDHPQVLRLST
jgi:protein transport protein SEC61 subunit beta